MNKKNKIIVLVSGILVILLMIFGVSFAVFRYEETGTNQEMVLGDIWMKYEETNGLVLSDAMPINIMEYSTYTVNSVMQEQNTGEDNELSRCMNIYTNWNYVFDEGTTAESFCKGEGTAYGLTIQEDLNYWIEDSKIGGYDFLEDGGRYLLDAGVIIQEIENLPYFEFEVSGKNTYTKKDIWYEIVLNHGDSHETRTKRIRDDLLRFSLVEIKDGVETTVINNKKYDDLINRRIWVNTISKNTNEEIEITYRLYMWIDESTIIGNSNQDYTLEEWEDVFASVKVNVTGDFNEKELAYEDLATDASCFTTYEINFYIHNENMTNEEVNKCVNYFTNNYLYIINSLDENSTIESFCRGVGTRSGMTFQDTLFDYLPNEAYDYFVENNIVISKHGLAINQYYTSCGTDVVIPRNIYNKDVLMISELNEKNLTSIVIPDTVIYLDAHSFAGNNLTYVNIPSSVLVIDAASFYGNQIKDLTLNEGIKVIGENAFTNNQITDITLPNSISTYYCDSFDQFVSITNPLNLSCIANCDGYYNNCGQ